MPEYQAFFSIGTKGVHAHLLDLPGCFARGANFEETLAQVPAAIRAYFETNGDPPPAVTGFRVIEVLHEGGGPFDPGDAAALFEAEKRPISPAEVDELLGLAEGNRARLLALAGELPENILDWQASPESFSIRRILRHVGNAEEWYVSRLVDSQGLPPEWENDAEMPLFDFLAMERRTVFERLRNLSEEHRSGVPNFPAHFSANAEEAWTARKALRRLLEHEREHTAQVQEVLADWRRHFLARLSAERSWFLWQLRGLTHQELSEHAVFEDWTAKDLLAHLGEWDWNHTGRIGTIASADWINVIDTGGAGYYEQENERLHREHRDLHLETVVQNTGTARQRFIASFQSLPDERLFREYELPHGDRLALSSYVQWRHRHDAMHAEEIRRLRQEAAIGREVGPKAILGAILNSALVEMLALKDIVTSTGKVTGDWTMRDVLGHLADWERQGVEALYAMLQGKPPPERAELSEADIEAWNAEHSAARSGQSLEQAAADYEDGRRSMLAALDGFSQDDLAGDIAPPWGGIQRLYDFFLEWPDHDREHAALIRQALSMPYPDRFKSV
jgi:predicted RNase H-like HicB family nuclease